MKAVNIDGDYYLYPSDVNNCCEFAEYIEKEKSKFIKLRRLVEKNCVGPYYIFEEIVETYVSIGNISTFYEDEIVLLSREEYDKLLSNVKNRLCLKCCEKESCFSDDKEEYRESLCLDGTCFNFCEE